MRNSKKLCQVHQNSVKAIKILDIGLFKMFTATDPKGDSTDQSEPLHSRQEFWGGIHTSLPPFPPTHTPFGTHTNNIISY